MNSCFVWKDLIVLKWDGTIPPEAPMNSIKRPSDVLYFWEHIGQHARWNDKLAGFLLEFSKQNLKRIHAQFGQIPIKNADQLIADLKAKNNEMMDVVDKAWRIKNLPFEMLPKYDYKVSPLGEYQHRGNIYLCNVPFAPFFAGCGSGKSFMTLTSNERMIKLGLIQPGKTLVSVKLPTLETGWLEDCEKFTNLKMESLWLPSGTKNRKEKILERLNSDADLFVINHEGCRVIGEELAQKKFERVVIDESTILKNFRGESNRLKGGTTGKALMKIAREAKYRVVMSGTPAPNGPQDLWGQFKFLDPNGLLFEPNFRDFQHEYMDFVDLRKKQSRYRTNPETGETYEIPRGPRDPGIWVPKKDTNEKMGRVVDKLAYRVRLRDVIKDMPDLTKERRVIEMTSDQKAHYEDMKKKLCIVIDDERIAVSMKLTQLMKLRQITGGFVIDDKEEVHAMDDNPKIAEMDSIVEHEIEHDEKIVIYAQYQHEIKMIESRYKKFGAVSVYGGNSSKKNLDNIKAFREDPKVRIIVLHPKSAAHGITFTCAHYMIFFSFDHSAEDEHQCKARIERAGQVHKMIVFYLMCKGSIDEDIYKVIETKNSNQANLIDRDLLMLRTLTKSIKEAA